MLEFARYASQEGATVDFLVADQIAERFQLGMVSYARANLLSGDIEWAYGPEDNDGGQDYTEKVKRQYAGFQKLLDRSEAKYDLVLLNANWPTHYAGVIQYLAERGLPFHVHFHLCPHRIHLNRQAATSYAAWLPRSKGLSCVSHNNRFYLERTFGSSLSFRVIPNGSRFSIPPPDDLRLVSRVREAEFIVVGRLDYQKGLLNTLPLLLRREYLGGYRVHIFGEGPLLDILQQHEREVDHIYLNGAVADIRDRFQRAEALIMPTFFEGMSLTILEALSLGCIPVASRASSASEIISDGYNGFLFDVGDWRSAMHAIQRYFLADRIEMRKNAIMTSRRFSRGHMLSQMLGQLRDYYP